MNYKLKMNQVERELLPAEIMGMSEEEMKEYLQDDLEIESLSTGQFLSEELTTMDVEWDETTEDDYEAQFESAD